MAMPQSDAFVFVDATGDLAFQQIFPTLQQLIRDEGLTVPIIGVAKAGWNLDQVRARAKDSLEKHGGADPDALRKLTGLLRYVDGDYEDSATFDRLAKNWVAPSGRSITSPFRPTCDAMRGIGELFAREDFVEAEWRLVDPFLGNVMPLYPYEPGSWGPEEAAQLIGSDGPWLNPRSPEATS
jgi:glucose-6-phosphate 1-dehydrogenase